MSNSFARILYYEMVLLYIDMYKERRKKKLGNVQNDKRKNIIDRIRTKFFAEKLCLNY